MITIIGQNSRESSSNTKKYWLIKLIAGKSNGHYALCWNEDGNKGRIS